MKNDSKYILMLQEIYIANKLCSFELNPYNACISISTKSSTPVDNCQNKEIFIFLLFYLYIIRKLNKTFHLCMVC